MFPSSGRLSLTSQPAFCAEICRSANWSGGGGVPFRQSGVSPEKLPVFWMCALLQAPLPPPPPLVTTATRPTITARASTPATTYPAIRRVRPPDWAARSAASRCARRRSFSSLREAIRGRSG